MLNVSDIERELLPAARAGSASMSRTVRGVLSVCVWLQTLRLNVAAMRVREAFAKRACTGKQPKGAGGGCNACADKYLPKQHERDMMRRGARKAS